MTTSSSSLNIARKMWGALTSAERRSAGMLLGLMFIGMILETLGAGLVIPAIALLTQRDLASSYPALEPALQALGNPRPETLVVGGMLVLAAVYLIKALFLG